MIGIYRTLDDCEYEVFWHQPDKRVKAELKIKCVRSTVRLAIKQQFTPVPGQIERNIKSGSWKKIA